MFLNARLAALVCVVGLFLSVQVAEATWSIVAVDPQTGEVGVAAASCSIGVPRIVAVVPGKGAIVSQAATSLTGREKARELVGQGEAATSVLAELEKPELYDGLLTIDFPLLQYGVATLGDNAPASVSTGFVTGESNPDWSGGEAGDTFSVQGNTLRGQDVVRNAARAFREAEEEAGACAVPLADRLLRALEAGRDAGGDARCPLDASSLAAVLVIARPADEGDVFSVDEVAPRRFSVARELVHLVVPYTPDPDLPEPVAQLRARYDASKAQDACF